MEALLSHCAAAFSREGGLFAAFFIGGLTGGFTHCLSMCGPFVACERACASPSCRMAGALSVATGLPYHLGRMTVYGLMGFLAALLARPLAANPHWPLASSLLLALAGLLFLINCVGFGAKASLAAPRLTYLRGTLLGFLPCGLLYAALMMAATLANPYLGMLAMWLFTLGTIPSLLLASSAAEIFARQFRPYLRPIGRTMMAFNGLSLLAMATHFTR